MSGPEFSVPVLIVGGGACGAVAALAAHSVGVEPLLIERDAYPSGSTGMSQGLFCAAGTRFQREVGVDDGPDQFFRDIMEKSRQEADPTVARLIADRSREVLEWLCDEHEFPWTLDERFRASYGNTRARIHGWSGHSGMDMVQWLHRRLDDLGVDVLCNTRLIDIITDEAGVVTSARIQGPNGEETVIGCAAIVLAAGGFGANRKMTGKFMPETGAFRYNGHEGSEGDAILLGEKIGAAVGDMGSYQGYAMLAEPGGISVPPNVLIEGGVILNANGERFTDEADDIAGMVLPLSAQPGGLGWVVFDKRIHAQCAHIPELRELGKLGVVRSASSMEELAARTGLPAAALARSLRCARQASKFRERDQFGRSWAEACAPGNGYFYVRVTGALYHTQGGLAIDDQARVRRRDRTAFPNLFAGGGSARSVSGSSSWGYLPAMGLTTAVTLGCVAGQNAARVAQNIS